MRGIAWRASERESFVTEHRVRMEGFLVLDHLDRRSEFEQNMKGLVEDGRVVVSVEWFNGLESIPRALASLTSGEKTGKALVTVGGSPASVA